MKTKKIWLILPLMLCLLLSGCLLQSAQELYALPRQPAEYYTLQKQLDAIVAAGGSYCAPISGDRRQAVQLADLDSDGTEEAIAYFRLPGEKPLRTYIFKKTEDGYTQYACIEGDGSAFESVSYSQIDTALGLELVLVRQVSDQVPQALSVYSVTGDAVQELLSVSCVRHTLADLDANGLQDLLVFRSEAEAATGLTEYYSCGADGMELRGCADMTAALTSDSIRRIVCGMMQEDTPAVFVANAYEPENQTIVTDVFMLDGGEFCNVSSRGADANAVGTVRYQRVYSEDIDGDGLVELPSPVRLPPLPGEENAGYYQIEWYNLRSDGARIYKRSTFHSYSDGWYIELTGDWQRGLAVGTVRDNRNTAGCGFFAIGTDGEATERFAIYALSGNDAQERARTPGRFVLAEKGGVVYAGEILDAAVTEAQLREAFHFIITDWNSGEV